MPFFVTCSLFPDQVLVELVVKSCLQELSFFSIFFFHNDFTCVCVIMYIKRQTKILMLNKH